MSRLPAAVASLVLACLPAAASGAAVEQFASRSAAGEPIAPARALQSGMSLEAAVDLVQRRYGGRVVRAETREDGGETVHRIRLLSDDGRVITVSVNARTGRID